MKFQFNYCPLIWMFGLNKALHRASQIRQTVSFEITEKKFPKNLKKIKTSFCNACPRYTSDLFKCNHSILHFF